MRRGWTAASLAGLCAIAACSSPAAATHPDGSSSRADRPTSAATSAIASRSAAARPGAGHPMVGRTVMLRS